MDKFPHRHIKHLIFSFESFKAIYFRVPKVASTSLLISFRKKYVIEKCEDYDSSYFKFAFVRNPFDRLASCYRHIIQKGAMQNIQNDSRFYRDMSFEQFVNIISEIKIQNMDIHFRPQYTFIPEKPDYMGKFEDLNKDFAEILQKIGINVELLHENKTNKTNFKDYYNQRIIDKVVKIYKKDFELFGYKKTLIL